MLIVASRNRSDGCIHINSRALQVLRLNSFTGPSAGGGAVITESTTDAIIIASTSKQGRDLLRCCLGPAQSKLQHPLNCWHQLGVEQLLLDCLAAQRLHDAVVLLQPCLQLGNLVDGGDVSGGDFGDLCVDLRRRSLGNLRRQR